MTIDIPDEAFRLLKTRAALSGMTVPELIRRLLRAGLRNPDGQTDSRRRGKLPTIASKSNWVVPNLSSRVQQKLDEAEDLVRIARSSRR